MNKKYYAKTISFFFNKKSAYTALKIAYKILPLLMFISYPILLIYEFFMIGLAWEWIRLAAIPLGVLVLVTLLRKLIKSERPYERYGIPSVFDKQTKGQSMPSRHTASAFIIAMTFLRVSLPLGVAALFIAVLIGLSRILAGAHFIRDAAVGAAISIAIGIIFLFLI